MLNDIKRREEHIKECEERINTGASKLGIPYAESTLKQIKSNLKSYQEYLDEYKLKLNQYTEEEIREAIDKEKEDEAAKEEQVRNEYIEDSARNYSREFIMELIEKYEKKIELYTKRLQGGIKTLGKHRGQPLTENDICSLKKDILYSENYIALYHEALKLKDKMRIKG